MYFPNQFCNPVGMVLCIDCCFEGVRHMVIDMETINGDILYHPTQVIYAHGQPSTTTGYYWNGVYFNGNQQYLDAGTDALCAGDLYNCARGYTMRF